MIQVLYSSEPKMLKSALRKVLKASLPTRDEMNFVTLDMGISKLIDLYNEVESLPLGYDKKAVVADNFCYLEKSKTKSKAMKNDDPDPLLSYFVSPNPEIDLFLLVYKDEIDERSRFCKALKEGGAKFSEVGLLSEEQWKTYASSYFEKRGCPISSEARDLLLERVKYRYTPFLSEAEKLVCYSNSELIEKDTVEKMVSAPLEEDVFLLSRSLSKGDKGKALAIYKDLKKNGTNAVTLMNLLAKEYRFLNEVGILQEQGYDAYSTARELSSSPGRVNASLYSLRRLSLRKIRDCQEMIYKALLSIMTGVYNEETAFTLLIANFPTAK